MTLEFTPDGVDALVRLAVSHLVLPADDQTTTARSLARIALRTLREALESIAGDRRFVLESIYGDVLSRKGDRSGSLAHYEEARKSCGTCGAPGQAIAFFNLGAAYASIVPPRKSEAIMNLQMFHKMICKGAAYARYADQCHEAQALVNTMGGALQ